MLLMVRQLVGSSLSDGEVADLVDAALAEGGGCLSRLCTMCVCAWWGWGGCRLSEGEVADLVDAALAEGGRCSLRACTPHDWHSFPVCCCNC